MSKTVLIVDDSSSMRKVLSTTLNLQGYKTIEACDGIDALGQLDGSEVDLVISDINMPNMDGITLVENIKKQPNHKFLPIMMLTTETDKELKERGKNAGAKAWIVKPFKPDSLVSVVRKLI